MVDPGSHALASLERLRRLETGEARRALAVALAREATLEAEIAGIEERIAAARRCDEVFDRESFAAWLARMAAKRMGLAQSQNAAAEATAAARRQLVDRSMAETAAKDALALARSKQSAAEARRDQAILEEAARAIRRG